MPSDIIYLLHKTTVPVINVSAVYYGVAIRKQPQFTQLGWFWPTMVAGTVQASLLNHTPRLHFESESLHEHLIPQSPSFHDIVLSKTAWGTTLAAHAEDWWLYLCSRDIPLSHWSRAKATPHFDMSIILLWIPSVPCGKYLLLHSLWYLWIQA